MRVDTRPRHRNAGRPPEKSAPGFLQWLRGRPCILARTGECRGKVRACHVDYAGDKGTSTKVSDRYSVPMCDGHHAEQHRGWKTFEAKHRLNCLAMAGEFWRLWPGRRAWESKFQSTEGE